MRRNHGRTGGARAGLVALAAALAALGSAAVWLLAPAAGRGAPQPSAALHAPGEPAAEISPRPAAAAPGATARGGAATAGADPPPPETPEGSGRVRLRLADGAAVARGWGVVVAPWRLHAAAGVPAARVEGAPVGASELVLELPWGSWALRALAGGSTSHVVRADLGPGADELALELALLQCARIEGAVDVPGGAPADGLAVAAVSPDDQILAQATTDPTGWFELAGLPPGPCRVSFGSPAGPILPPLEPNLEPGELLRLGAVELPALGELEVVVLDAAGAWVPGAEVHGSGDGGARFDLRTDASGRCRARHLLAGSWRVHAQDGRARGNRLCQVAAGEVGQVEVVLRE